MNHDREVSHRATIIAQMAAALMTTNHSGALQEAVREARYILEETEKQLVTDAQTTEAP